MSRLTLTILIVLWGHLNIYAQNTYYYRLTKTIQKKRVSTNVSGGQFVTFSDGICFESNKNGTGVGHGKLTYNKNYSNARMKVYTGKSYWGNNSAFKFSSDLSTLNVATKNGEIYVYKRSVAPHGVTTCSLIRKPESAGSGSSSGRGGYHPVQPNYPSIGGYNSSGTSVIGNEIWGRFSMIHFK